MRENDEVVVADLDGKILYRGSLRGMYDEVRNKWLKPGFEYWALNKPRGVLASTRDPHHKNMVTHLIPTNARIFPVGRLDKDSEGLLLMTSDGNLCHRLTHPRFGVFKTYQVSLDWPASPATLSAISRGGIKLEDGPTLPVKIKKISPRVLELQMREGRKREIRRIFSYFGHKVVRLVRVAFGPIELGNLAPGEARRLKESEVDNLRKATPPPRGKRPHHSVENKDTVNEKRRPGSRRPGQRWGRKSSKSSTLRRSRKGSRSNHNPHPRRT